MSRKTFVILITAALLQAVFLMVPVCTMPVLAQSADTTSSTTTDTAAQVKAANEELLLNSDKFTYKTADIEVRKDAWNWYWNEKAHVNTVTWRIIWQGLANYLAKSNSPEQERLAGNFYQIRGNRSHPVEPLQSLYLCENTM